MSFRAFRAAFAAVLTSLCTLVFVATAGGAPQPDPGDPRVPLTAPNATLSGYCEGFDVSVEFTKYNQYIIRQSTTDGTTTYQIAGNARATVTNLSTGESVSFNVSGPGTLVIYPDNSFSIDAAGPNLLWTLPENLEDFPDVPTISYSTGHVTLTVDASGQTTSYTLAGGARQTDVCALLAP